MVNNLVDRLIRGKIIEIFVVLIMVTLSIPVWNVFGKKISNANVVDIDEYNLDFNIQNNNNSDILTVRNDYKLNKSFKIILRVNKEVNIANSSLTVNDKFYKLNDFEQTEKGSYIYFTIAVDYIIADTFTYIVTPYLDGMIINYAYIFEENIVSIYSQIERNN